MIGIAAAIGVVAASRDLALVIEQPIEHMRGFAGGRRDHLDVERCIAVGEVGAAGSAAECGADAGIRRSAGPALPAFRPYVAIAPIAQH
jgi:hypothetical protein